MNTRYFARWAPVLPVDRVIGEVPPWSKDVTIDEETSTSDNWEAIQAEVFDVIHTEIDVQGPGVIEYGLYTDKNKRRAVEAWLVVNREVRPVRAIPATQEYDKSYWHWIRGSFTPGHGTYSMMFLESITTMAKLYWLDAVRTTLTGWQGPSFEELDRFKTCLRNYACYPDNPHSAYNWQRLQYATDVLQAEMAQRVIVPQRPLIMSACDVVTGSSPTAFIAYWSELLRTLGADSIDYHARLVDSFPLQVLGRSALIQYKDVP